MSSAPPSPLQRAPARSRVAHVLGLALGHRVLAQPRGPAWAAPAAGTGVPLPPFYWRGAASFSCLFLADAVLSPLPRPWFSYSLQEFPTLEHLTSVNIYQNATRAASADAKARLLWETAFILTRDRWSSSSRFTCALRIT